jgi:hypothetical protein
MRSNIALSPRDKDNSHEVSIHLGGSQKRYQDPNFVYNGSRVSKREAEEIRMKTNQHLPVIHSF